ncbi:PAAR domain-containing protein, partial [Polyangium fumosum]
MSEATPLEQAVRIDDAVEHSLAFLGAVLGALGGLALGLLVFGTGPLGWLAAAGVAVYFSNAGEKAFKNLKHEAGDVAEGSPNVFVGEPGRNAARARDKVRCHDLQIATGCATISINQELAARVKEETVCDGKLKTGCETVFYGGPSARVLAKRFSGELPEWFYVGREVVDWVTILAPTGAADPSKWWRLYDRVSRGLTFADKAAGYTAAIAQGLGYQEVADVITRVTDHPAYVWGTTAFGGVGVARDLRRARGGPPPPPGPPPPGPPPPPPPGPPPPPPGPPPPPPPGPPPPPPPGP